MMAIKDLDLEKSTTEFLLKALVNGTSSLAARERIASELKKRFYQEQSEQFLIFRAAYILHKYYAKGNLRPIENLASMVVDIFEKANYEASPADLEKFSKTIQEKIQNAVTERIGTKKESE